MFGPALKLGAATGIGYAFGGMLGMGALKMFKPEAEPDTVTAAAWAGRVAVFFIAAAVINKVV